MDIMKLEQRDTITSLELLEIINDVRESENKSKLEHKYLLKIIRDELGENFSLSEYEDITGKENILYILSLAQARQIGARQSKTIRQAIFKYIELLENKIKELERENKIKARLLSKITRKEETTAIKKLIKYGNVAKDKEKFEYMKYSKLPWLVLGYSGKKKPTREELTQSELIILEKIENEIQNIILNNIIDGVPFAFIYSDVKEKINKLTLELKEIYLQEYKKEKLLHQTATSF